jgi:hypothetical protein
LLKAADFLTIGKFLGNDYQDPSIAGLLTVGTGRPAGGFHLTSTVMSNNASMPLRDQLELQVRNRTGRRIRNLAIELNPERVVLRGQVNSYYVKQLAQHGIRDCIPDLVLENSIVVERELNPLLDGA